MKHLPYLILGALCLAAVDGITIKADAAAIYTGGDKGAYNSLFCPPLPDALSEKYFPGYKCTPSAGTVDNISKVLANPTDIGFAQLDIFNLKKQQDPANMDKLVIIRQLACEGLWLVTKNKGLANYGDVLGYARRIPFLLPPETSGASATFKSLMAMDPDGLGRARNIEHVSDVTTMLNQVAASVDGEVGFFVQFADPSNDNIKLLVDKELTVIPLVTRDMLKLQVDGVNVYQVQEFTLEDKWADTTATTACTPAVIFTGNPASMADPLDQKDQQEMIDAINSVPADDLLPKVGWLANLMKNVQAVTGEALEDLVTTIEQVHEDIKNRT